MSVQKASNHFEYLKSHLLSLDIDWQPIRREISAHEGIDSNLLRRWNTAEWICVLRFKMTSCAKNFARTLHHQGTSVFIQLRFGSLHLLEGKISIESGEISNCGMKKNATRQLMPILNKVGFFSLFLVHQI